MNFTKSKIDGFYFIKLQPFKDKRGSFVRNFCFSEIKTKKNFVIKQCNLSINKKKGTLRGFHYQKNPSKESKIINIISGSIFNAVVDLRKKSPTYKKKITFTIKSNDKKSFLVPEGCANAFLTLEDNTVIQYFMSDFFKNDSYSGFNYKDPFLNIKWPFEPIIISKKDKNLNFLNF